MQPRKIEKNDNFQFNRWQKLNIFILLKLKYIYIEFFASLHLLLHHSASFFFLSLYFFINQFSLYCYSLIDTNQWCILAEKSPNHFCIQAYLLDICCMVKTIDFMDLLLLSRIKCFDIVVAHTMKYQSYLFYTLYVWQMVEIVHLSQINFNQCIVMVLLWRKYGKTFGIRPKSCSYYFYFAFLYWTFSTPFLYIKYFKSNGIRLTFCSLLWIIAIKGHCVMTYAKINPSIYRWYKFNYIKVWK